MTNRWDHHPGPEVPALLAEVRRLRDERRAELMRVAEAAFRAGYDECMRCWAPEEGECPECGVGQDRGEWDETYRASPERVAEIAAIVGRVMRETKR